jgi:hypothetical protein
VKFDVRLVVLLPVVISPNSVALVSFNVKVSITVSITVSVAFVMVVVEVVVEQIQSDKHNRSNQDGQIWLCKHLWKMSYVHTSWR